MTIRDKLKVAYHSQVAHKLRVIQDCTQRALDALEEDPGEMIDLAYLEKQARIAHEAAQEAVAIITTFWADVLNTKERSYEWERQRQAINKGENP